LTSENDVFGKDKDRDLMAQHQDLHLLVPVADRKQPQ
jgi:hypothetical protein